MDETIRLAYHNTAEQNKSEAVSMNAILQESTTASNAQINPSSELRTHQGAVYGTPPTSFSEAVSPLSSKKHGKTQAVSLGIDPSASRDNHDLLPSDVETQQMLASLYATMAPSAVAHLGPLESVRQPMPRIRPHRRIGIDDGPQYNRRFPGLPELSAISLHRSSQPYPCNSNVAQTGSGAQGSQFVSDPSLTTGNSSRSIPQVGFANATALDPSLLTDTLHMVYARHTAERDRLKRELRENEDFLTSFLAQYGHQFASGPISPGVHTMVSDQHSKALNNGSFSRPLPFVSRTASVFGCLSQPQRGLNTMQSSPQESESSVDRLGTAPQGSGLRAGTTDSQGELQNKGDGSSGQVDSGGSRAVAQKKKKSRKKPEKQPVWYADLIAQADFPKSVISRESMQAGLDYDPKKTAPKKAKGKRPGEEVIKARESFTFSKEASAKLLVQHKNGTLHPGLAKIMPSTDQLSHAIASNAVIEFPRNTSVHRENRNLKPGDLEDSMSKSFEGSNQALQGQWNSLKSKDPKGTALKPDFHNAVPKRSTDGTNCNNAGREEASKLSSNKDDDPNDPPLAAMSYQAEYALSKRTIPLGSKRMLNATEGGGKRLRTSDDSQTS
ncbi:hypothetical protein MMC13_002112 [Lambiella insularis]|nr:hypothetical protein [Lambiella insularis]